jgi:hypothetical protein
VSSEAKKATNRETLAYWSESVPQLVDAIEAAHLHQTENVTPSRLESRHTTRHRKAKPSDWIRRPKFSGIAIGSIAVIVAPFAVRYLTLQRSADAPSTICPIRTLRAR